MFSIRWLLAIALFVLSACGPSGGSATGLAASSPSATHNYTLAVVSGDGQIGYAMMGYYGVSSALLPEPLVVEVRENGNLVDNVSVRFTGTNAPNGTYLGPLGLGQTLSGFPCGQYAGATHGQAKTVAQAYTVGIVPCTATVDPPGTSNTVTFFVIGQ